MENLSRSAPVPLTGIRRFVTIVGSTTIPCLCSALMALKSPSLVVTKCAGTESANPEITLAVHRDGQREEIASLILQDPCAGERRFLPLGARARTENADANHKHEQAARRACCIHGRPDADRTSTTA